jgi:hypothetical protein
MTASSLQKTEPQSARIVTWSNAGRLRHLTMINARNFLCRAAMQTWLARCATRCSERCRGNRFSFTSRRQRSARIVMERTPGLFRMAQKVLCNRKRHNNLHRWSPFNLFIYCARGGKDMAINWPEVQLLRLRRKRYFLTPPISLAYRKLAKPSGGNYFESAPGPQWARASCSCSRLGPSGKCPAATQPESAWASGYPVRELPHEHQLEPYPRHSRV